LAPDVSALSTVAYAPDAADDLTNRDAHHRQYVSGPLAAQTLSGNVKAQFQCLETFANDNLFLTLKILVCSNDGSTTLATLLAITRDTTNELTTSLINRNFPSTALSSYACAAGDRLVIEVGLGGSITTGTGGVIGHNGSIRWGCSASSDDLPEDDTQTGTTYRPWLEFSNTFQFLGEGDGDAAGAAADAVVGGSIFAGVLSAAAAASSAIIGAALWLALAASPGVASDAVSSASVAAADVASAGAAIALADGDDAAGAGSTGAAVGVASDSVVSSAINVGVANAGGATDSAIIASSTVGTDGQSAGTAADAVNGAALAGTLGASSGSATETVVGSALWPMDGISAGAALASGAGEDASGGGSILEADGASAGAASSSANGSALWLSVFESVGAASAVALAPSTGTVGKAGVVEFTPSRQVASTGYGGVKEL
jgi:hypothetical protein